MTTVADLLDETGHVDVKVQDLTVGVDYRVFWEEQLTQEEWDTINKLPSREYLPKAIPPLVLRWDLQGADGEPVPLTEEGIMAAKVPPRFLRMVEQAVLADQQAGKESSPPSPAT